VNFRRWPPWLLATLFFLVAYHRGLWIWFRADDFAWLLLSHQWVQASDLVRLLFQPMAQGTIRPLSERAYFLLLGTLFGLNSLPFRLVVHGVQIGNLILLSDLAQRLTGSPVAATLAPLLWVNSLGVVEAFAWTSSFNQLLCTLWILLGLRWFLQWTETGQRGYYWLQWVALLGALGSLESGILLPTLITGLAWARACQRWRLTLWLWIPAVLYAGIHHWLAPPPQTGPYALHLGWNLLASLGQYWLWAFGGDGIRSVVPRPPWPVVGLVAAVFLSLLVSAFLAKRVWQGDRLAIWLVGWFTLFVSPYLPLRDHFSLYYLTIPAVALAVAASWMVATIGRRWLAALVVVTFLGVYVPASQVKLGWFLRQSLEGQYLMQNLQLLRQRHPNQVILLTGVSPDTFWSTLAHGALEACKLREVYVAEECQAQLQISAPMEPPVQLFLPGPIAARLLDAGELVVYQAGVPFRNVTRLYGASLPRFWHEAWASRVEAGQRVFAGQLGEGWYGPEWGHRWMARRATVLLGVPPGGAQRLVIEGFCPVELVRSGPLEISVSLGSRFLGRRTVAQPGAFRLELAVGAPLPEPARIALQLNKTFQSGADRRPLGVAISRVCLR